MPCQQTPPAGNLATLKSKSLKVNPGSRRGMPGRAIQDHVKSIKTVQCCNHAMCLSLVVGLIAPFALNLRASRAACRFLQAHTTTSTPVGWNSNTVLTINTEHPAKNLLLRLGCVHLVTHVFIRTAAKPRDLEGLCALWLIEKHKNVGLKSIL